MTFYPIHKYYGDDRDILEAIYPSCTTFVLTRVPEASQRFIEVVLDPTNEEEAKLFGTLCYFYEDSYDWEKVPVIFRRSEISKITWFIDGSAIRVCSLADGVKHFDAYTDEMIRDH